jgi:DNA polymerase III psi subunit
MISEIAGTLFTEEVYRIGKKTIVITSDPWDRISDSDRSLLQKILQAVGLSTDAVTIVHQPTLALDSIRENASRVIYFGSAVSGLMHFEPSKVDDLSVISSPSLEQLQVDASSKQKLWAGLKVLFSK